MALCRKTISSTVFVGAGHGRVSTSTGKIKGRPIVVVRLEVDQINITQPHEMKVFRNYHGSVLMEDVPPGGARKV